MKLTLALGLAVTCTFTLFFQTSGANGHSESGGASGPAQPAAPGEVAEAALAVGASRPGEAASLVTRQLAADFSAELEDLALAATLSFLDPRTLEPANCPELRLRHEGGRVVDLASGQMEPVRLDLGEWSIEAAERGWVLNPSRVRLEAGDQAAVWTAAQASARVRVISTLGQPIEGARLEWWGAETDARLNASRQRAEGPGEVAWSGPQGRADFPQLGLGIGRFRVTAAGFQPEVQVHTGGGEYERTIVLQQSDGPGRLLRFLAAESGRPVGEISARGYAGEWITDGGRDGELLVPAWLGEGEFLYLSAPGRATAALSLDELGPDVSEIEWARAVNLKVSAADGSMLQGHTLLQDSPAGPLVYLTEEGADLDPSKEIERVLPGNAKVQVLCSDLRGRTGSLEIEVLESDIQATVSLETPRALEVAVQDSTGRVLNDGEAIVTLARSGRELRVQAGKGGLIKIPLEPAVRWVEVQAGGCASAMLEPLASSADDQIGHLDLVLRPTSDLEVVLTDLAGSPCSGVQVQVEDRQSYDAFRLYPELNGCMPTQHSGWALSAPRWVTATADATGRVRARRLALGDYELRATVPTALDPGSSSTYRPSPILFDHASSTPLSLSLPIPVLVSVEARSMPSNAPVESVRIQSLEHPALSFPSQRGARWQGWIDPSIGPLVVSSPGHSSARLDGAMLASSREFSVDLRADQGSVLVLSGDWSSIPEGSLRITARRPWMPGSTEHGTREVWSSDVKVEEGLAELHFPFEGEYTFEPVADAGHMWEFEPESIYWSPGVLPQVRVQRVERQFAENGTR